jgi:hypothetical protein
MNALISVCFTNPVGVTRVANSPRSLFVTNPAVLIFVTFRQVEREFLSYQRFHLGGSYQSALLTFVISPSSSHALSPPKQ